MENERNLPVNIGSEETALTVGAGYELQVTTQNALALQEIQGAIIVAKKFPRNTDEVFAAVMKACQRQTMAEKAAYSFPRGAATITGPSVYLARIIAGRYGNIRFGVDIIRDDENSRLIRGWCWDVENNTKVQFDDDFQKLIYRKQGGWIKPDERDLRELTNRRGAILMRNAIFNIVPRDLVEDALGVAKSALKSGIKDPAGEKKKLILAFDSMGVTVKMVNDYLEHETWDMDDIVELQGILNAIKDGAAKRDDYFKQAKPETSEAPIDMKDMSSGDELDHKGHDQAKPQGKKGAGF